MKNIKKIFLVGAGKGGVGKSMVSVNLALALSTITRKEIGLLDADIYGPSIPTIFGLLNYKADINSSSSLIEAPLKGGIRSMSISYLSDGGSTVWRGPMLMKGLMVMLQKVDWSTIEYLIIDLPPGTGDAPLSIQNALKGSIDGALLVSTTNSLSISDVCRASTMFDLLRIPVLGIVQNMTTHKCPSCGVEDLLHSTLQPSLLSKTNSNSLSKLGPTLLSLPFDTRMGSLLDSGGLFNDGSKNPFKEEFLKLAEKIIFPLKNETSK